MKRLQAVIIAVDPCGDLGAVHIELHHILIFLGVLVLFVRMAVGFGITQNDLKGFAGVQGDLIFGALGGAVKGAQGGAIIFPYHTNTGGLVGGGLVGYAPVGAGIQHRIGRRCFICYRIIISVGFAGAGDFRQLQGLGGFHRHRVGKAAFGLGFSVFHHAANLVRIHGLGRHIYIGKSALFAADFGDFFVLAVLLRTVQFVVGRRMLGAPFQGHLCGA